MVYALLFLSLACLALGREAALLRRAAHTDADALARLHGSLTYEAIALYDEDAAEPSFVWTPAAFGPVLGREDTPLTGSRHWDYWAFARPSRPDWERIIRRVCRTGIAETRQGEVIVYPDGTRVVIDWTCGPSHDAGRRGFLGVPFLGGRPPKRCGFYITHRRSEATPDPAISEHVAAMEQRAADLQESLDAARRQAARLAEKQRTARARAIAERSLGIRPPSPRPDPGPDRADDGAAPDE